MEMDKQNAQTLMRCIMGQLDVPVTDLNLNKFKEAVCDFAASALNDPQLPGLLINKTLMSREEWAQLALCIETLNKDYVKRATLLKRRAEVTIDSFLWSDRVEKMEGQIREIVANRGQLDLEFQPFDESNFLAADSSLLCVTKTSAEQLRMDTRNHVKNYCVKADNIPDRGGRTEQIVVPATETFHQQQHQRQQHHRGGNWRGGGGDGWKSGRSAGGGGSKKSRYN